MLFKEIIGRDKILKKHMTIKVIYWSLCPEDDSLTGDSLINGLSWTLVTKPLWAGFR